MKRYGNCIFLFAGMCILCVCTAIAADQIHRRELKLLAREESLEERERLLFERKEEIPVISTDRIRPESGDPVEEEPDYYLVTEDGFLLVYQKEGGDTCLYTHIPISEFPVEEQERIREGIQFYSMMEVMNYLESFTS